MKLGTLCVGPLETNCYVVYDEAAKEAAIIDPGDSALAISEFIDEIGLKPVVIMLTHSHYDHVGAVEAIREKYGASLAIHENEKRLLEKGGIAAPDILFKDGEKYSPFTNGESFTVIHTPGHTEGGASYYLEDFDAVFTGDTLFKASIGRTDLETGSYKEIISSIVNKLIPLGDNVVAYPGHGDKTTIGEEKSDNRFLKDS